MMRKVTQMNHGTHIKRMAGMLLLEVVLGIVVFVVGMLALAHLQGNLTRSGADANTRTVGTNVAEEIIETARAFEQVPSDPNGIISAFADIVTATRTVTRGGIAYTVNITVDDYYYSFATKTFSTTAPVGAVYSDFKYLQVEVVWNASQEFQISEGQTTSDRLGSGSITLTDVISSIPTFSSAKIASGQGDQEFYRPKSLYDPGLRPDAVPMTLGNSRFKETTTPVSEVDTKTGIVETWFDVATYQQDGLDAIFLRREEFVTVGCKCSLLAPTTDSGRRPTVWDGAEYTEGEFVTKTSGERPDESANNPAQSNFCIQCCRDHHDGGTGSNDQSLDPGRSLYDPFKSAGDYHTSGTFAGDHKHYNRDDVGNLVVVDSAGDEYLEACRLVRKDGFFRVAQDFRQEGLFAFPEDYLDSDAEVSEYSGYVAGAVAAYENAVADGYESNPPTLLTPASSSPSVTFPASTSVNPTSLPTALGSNSQQMRSRGLYIDYMSDDLRKVILCLDGGGSAEACGANDVLSSAEEVIPSFDIQLTWLTRWNDTPVNTPVDVSNEPILTANAHSRGLAELQSGGTGLSQVDVNIHKGTLGFTGTDPIIPADFSEYADSGLYVSSAKNLAAATTDFAVVSGYFLSGVTTLGFNVADLTLTGSGARCGRTDAEYSCAIDFAAASPTVTVSGYTSSGSDTKRACSNSLVIDAWDKGWTRFLLPKGNTTGANIVMVPSSTCPVF